MGILKFFEPKQKTKQHAFEGLYQSYYHSIVRRIAYLISDVHVAEELTQDVFIKLYEQPPQHENIGAWLNTVAARTAYNYLRDDKSHRQKELEHYQPMSLLEISAEDAAIQNDEAKATHQALELLSVRDRTCLLMKHSGYKYAEIAECLELDILAVGTIISRAQSKFKAHFERQYEKGGSL